MSSRQSLTLREVLFAVALIVILLGLLFPSVQGAREAARRNSCVCHGKQIALSVHNHYDVFKRLPNSTSTRIRRVRPGCAGPVDDAPPAGYGWQVKVLPYQGETDLYNSISKASDKFSRSAFDPNMIPNQPAANQGSEHLAHSSFGFYQCPSFSGPRFSVAPEYLPYGGVETNTYVAISATDLGRMMDRDDEEAANGVLVPAPQKLHFEDIEDGTSKTFLFAETRESRYSSWYDGTVSWTVGANPNGEPPGVDEDDFIVPRSSTAINVGPDRDSLGAFLPRQLHGAIQQDWQWGPSSEHSGGVVTHGVADGSVRTITEDIDATLYLRLITRSGKEPVNLPD